MTMTPLRQQMIDAMRQRGFSERTHQSYLAAVRDLARYTRRSPAELGVSELEDYFKHLALERGLSGASCRLYLNGIRFLYLHVLKWPHFDVPLVVPKLAQRIPELLTRAEVGRILGACANPKHRMLLTLCYGCGLRVSELVAVRVRHIDGERRLLRVEQGKGAKDRVVILAPALLDALRRYWRRYRPVEWLFPRGEAGESPLSVATAQKVFLRAKRQAGVQKVGGIHSLRHAYATHQLEKGLAVHHLQRLLGHGNLRSTMRYIHWVPGTGAPVGTHADLLGALEVGHG
jgi:integrase/recombinase XerD